MMPHQNKTLLNSPIQHMEDIYTHTHTLNSKRSFQMTIHPRLSGYRNTFSKQHFIFAFFLFGVFAIWTPVTYFHLAAESLQDCQHFKRVKPFTLYQQLNQNIKTLLCFFFVIRLVISYTVKKKHLCSKNSPVSSNQTKTLLQWG